MNFLKALLRLLTGKIAMKAIELRTAEVRQEIKQTENEISAQLARDVGLKAGDLDFQIRPSACDHVIPKVVLHVPVTLLQLRTLQAFLDHYDCQPRNVPAPKGLN